MLLRAFARFFGFEGEMEGFLLCIYIVCVCTGTRVDVCELFLARFCGFEGEMEGFYFRVILCVPVLEVETTRF